MRFCNDCGEQWGFCQCQECGHCGELATDKCFHCEGDFCEEHLQLREGHSHLLRYCAPCLETLATYKPCANSARARKCADMTFAPELLHECATCGQDFCAACIVKTPVPGSIRLAQHHCPRCFDRYGTSERPSPISPAGQKQQEQIVAA